MKELWTGLRVEVIRMEDVVAQIQVNARSGCGGCGGTGGGCPFYGPPPCIGYK